MTRITRIIHNLIICLFLIVTSQNSLLHAQEDPEKINATENVYAKGTVASESEIKLRWSPANPKAWADGKKYGYTIERYTMMIDKNWQDNPIKEVFTKDLKPKPLTEWKDIIETSDYAAVIAQAFYGEDFEVNTTSNNMASIINQAQELQQRFSMSVFMAEYDYKAAEFAGWAFSDKTAKKNEKYLYRIYLNRPDKVQGDTAAVYISYTDKKELPRPLRLNTMFGDKSVILSWNYSLLSDTYHSYFVERMSSDEKVFKRITDLPVTPMNADMSEILYTDSLTNNETEYSYRVSGVTCFGEIGPVSDTISGHGYKKINCIPQIYSGYFTDKDQAHIFWELDCPEIDLIQKHSVTRSQTIDGDYETVLDSIPVHLRDYSLYLPNDENYIKLQTINKDGHKQESFPFRLMQTDSIPPTVPSGLKAVIDSTGVAHLSWDANIETDLRGYRLLRSFTPNGEKSSLISDFITETQYTDTLSLSLGNPKVYYSLTAIDNRYNESKPCEDVVATKPNMVTPAEPTITSYEINDNKVTISWITDTNRPDIKYTLTRSIESKNPSEEVVFSGDYKVNTYIDEASESGRYSYLVAAYSPDGKKSISPQKLNLDITVEEKLNEVGGFNTYVDKNQRYIELSWRKNSKAKLYRIYKAEDDKKMTLWQELDATQNRVVDELIAIDTKYTYTILFISDEGRASKAKTIIVNY